MTKRGKGGGVNLVFNNESVKWEKKLIKVWRKSMEISIKKIAILLFFIDGI